MRREGEKTFTAERLRELKRQGFSDRRLATLDPQHRAAGARAAPRIRRLPVYKRVDTCAAEFATATAYMYSTYEEECEAEPSRRRKIMILGGGPNRIGQGIEFDYCCVHAALALREDGFETIMVNCNPETVSTDYDTSDRLYFEPLTLEDVLEIIHKERPEGVIVQFGGQTPLKLARALEAAGAPIIGTTPDSIDIAEDRERFQQLVKRLGLRQPANATARNEEQAVAAGARGGLSAGGAALLRARRPRDGDRLQRGRPAQLRQLGRQGLQRQPGAARSLPRRGRRGRRGCGLRRHRRADRRHHGARRAGGRALGRFKLLAAAHQPVAADPGRTARANPQAGARTAGGGADEYPVCDPERHHLPARGQSRAPRARCPLWARRPACRSPRSPRAS